MEHGGTGSSHSRIAPGTVRVIGADEVSLVSWHLRARRLVGSTTRRLGGSSALRPSGRGPGCGLTLGPI